MNWFDVNVAFSSGLVKSYNDFLLSYDYPLRVLIPFKNNCKGKQNVSVLRPISLSTIKLKLKICHEL